MHEIIKAIVLINLILNLNNIIFIFRNFKLVDELGSFEIFLIVLIIESIVYMEKLHAV